MLCDTNYKNNTTGLMEHLKIFYKAPLFQWKPLGWMQWWVIIYLTSWFLLCCWLVGRKTFFFCDYLYYWKSFKYEKNLEMWSLCESQCKHIIHIHLKYMLTLHFTNIFFVCLFIYWFIEFPINQKKKKRVLRW